MPSIDQPVDGPDPAPHRAAERRILLETAVQSIAHGLRQGRALRPVPADYPEPLRRHGASFVTLERAGALRGCIGTLEAHQPLIVDVAVHAFAAAFEDPRFPPLRDDEFPALELHLSLLTPARPLRFASEAELLAQLRPGQDGLILEDDGHRGTFLPSVWDSLPDPRDFLTQLKRKAGLPATHWSDRLRVARYTTESFGDTIARLR